MIKVVGIGVWLVAVALAATYGGALWSGRKAAGATAEPKQTGKLETVKIRMLSVPIIAGGEVEGYVVAKLGYTAFAAALKALSLKPDDIVSDEAFRALYTGWQTGGSGAARPDLAAMSQQIVAAVNQRLGQPVVREILIQDLNFIHKRDVRKGPAP